VGSYSGVENTPDDLEILEGATITKIQIVPDGYGDDKIVMDVKYRKGLNVNELDHGRFEIWQDVEGNGPGYLAFVGADDG
jgi:hypothetical protein